MGDWPNREDMWGLGWSITPGHTLSSFNPAMFLTSGGGTNPVSSAWPATNRAIFIPFRIPKIATLYRATIGSGTTASGNFDVGVYDDAGNKIVSSGATAKGNGTETHADITDTVLGPGRYYMAMSADGTNNYVALAAAAVPWLKLAGVLQASSAYTLPATVTFATVASAFLPLIQLRFRSYA